MAALKQVLDEKVIVIILTKQEIHEMSILKI